MDAYRPTTTTCLCFSATLRLTPTAGPYPPEATEPSAPDATAPAFAACQSSSGAPPTPAARSTASGRRTSLALRTHAGHHVPSPAVINVVSHARHAATSTPRAARHATQRNARPIRSLDRWALADHAANREMAGATMKAVVAGYRVAADWGDGEQRSMAMA